LHYLFLHATPSLSRGVTIVEIIGLTEITEKRLKNKKIKKQRQNSRAGGRANKL